jgi:hypothetical protein
MKMPLPTSLLLAALAPALGCSLPSMGSGSSQPADYVGNWVSAAPVADGSMGLHVHDDGTFEMDQLLDNSWTPYDQGTWSSPSAGILELDGFEVTSWTMQTGCELLVYEQANVLQRQDAASSCSMPSAALSDLEACILGKYEYATSSWSVSGMVASDSSENDTLTLDASRTFTYETTTYQGQAGDGTQVQGVAAATWTYADDVLTLKPVPIGDAATVAVTTDDAGHVCIGGTCFDHVFSDGCTARSP